MNKIKSTLNYMTITAIVMILQSCSDRTVHEDKTGIWSRTLNNGETEIIAMKNKEDYVLQRGNKVGSAIVKSVNDNTVLVELKEGYALWKAELGEMQMIVYDSNGNIEVTWSKLEVPVKYIAAKK